MSSSWQTPSQNYGVSVAIWDHTILLATQNRRTHPYHNLSQYGWYSIYVPWRHGRLSWPRWLDCDPAGSWTCDHLIESPTPKPPCHQVYQLLYLGIIFCFFFLCAFKLSGTIPLETMYNWYNDIHVVSVLTSGAKLYISTCWESYVSKSQAGYSHETVVLLQLVQFPIKITFLIPFIDSRHNTINVCCRWQQEAEEQRLKEEQAQREHEEYLKMKEAFTVEEEGTDAIEIEDVNTSLFVRLCIAVTTFIGKFEKSWN